MTSFLSLYDRNGFAARAEAEEFLSTARVTARDEGFVITVFTRQGPTSYSSLSYDFFKAL